ncbi:MAG: ferritin-like domain-containing protein [Beijerinckiaceae bacterium]|nr:ferritin-like domain-containing protein [Beijerinckiaceae bacterium]
MGWWSKDIHSLNDLFVHALRDIYYAEKQILKTLPEMINKANDPQLKRGFEKHRQETEQQVRRIEEVFRFSGIEAKAIDCPAIDGILKEANETAGEADNKNVLDVALIFSAQAVEHYEITRYGSLIAWARLLGRPDCAKLLEQNLAEEKATDTALNAIAEGGLNQRAAA